MLQEIPALMVPSTPMTELDMLHWYTILTALGSDLEDSRIQDLVVKPLFRKFKRPLKLLQALQNMYKYDIDFTDLLAQVQDTTNVPKKHVDMINMLCDALEIKSMFPEIKMTYPSYVEFAVKNDLEN